MNPYPRIAELEKRVAELGERLTIALASRDAYAELCTKEEADHAFTRNQVRVLNSMLREEWLRHANTRRQAREDTEALHDELENTQKALDHVKSLVSAPTPFMIDLTGAVDDCEWIVHKKRKEEEK